MPLYRDGAFVSDPWTFPSEDSALLADGAIAFSKTQFLAERAALIQRNAPLGLVLQAGENFDGIENDLARFAMIALTFPKFSDGRAYSLAWLLHERFAFKGEIRARGDVLRDQIAFMLRAGFTTLDITHEGTIKALEANAVVGVAVRYQPGVDGKAEITPPGARPWVRVRRTGI